MGFLFSFTPISCVSTLSYPPTPKPPFTSDNEFALVLHSSSLVPGNAGVVSVVHECEVRDTQGAGKVDVVYSDSKAGWNWSAVLLPGDENGLVTRHDHAGDEHPLPDGKPWKLKGVDGGWN